jgi:hypothetical protein
MASQLPHFAAGRPPDFAKLDMKQQNNHFDDPTTKLLLGA